MNQQRKDRILEKMAGLTETMIRLFPPERQKTVSMNRSGLSGDFEYLPILAKQTMGGLGDLFRSPKPAPLQSAEPITVKWEPPKRDYAPVIPRPAETPQNPQDLVGPRMPIRHERLPVLATPSQPPVYRYDFPPQLITGNPGNR